MVELGMWKREMGDDDENNVEDPSALDNPGVRVT